MVKCAQSISLNTLLIFYTHTPTDIQNMNSKKNTLPHMKSYINTNSDTENMTNNTKKQTKIQYGPIYEKLVWK